MKKEIKTTTLENAFSNYQYDKRLYEASQEKFNLELKAFRETLQTELNEKRLTLEVGLNNVKLSYDLNAEIIVERGQIECIKLTTSTYLTSFQTELPDEVIYVNVEGTTETGGENE